MFVMRELSDKFKLSARSVGEVFEAINAMVSRCRTTGEAMYRGKNLTREALVNAAILYVDSLPPKQKIQALIVGLGRLETILENDPADMAKESSSEKPSGVIRALATQDLTASQLKREREQRRSLPREKKGKDKATDPERDPTVKQ